MAHLRFATTIDIISESTQQLENIQSLLKPIMNAESIEVTLCEKTTTLMYKFCPEHLQRVCDSTIKAIKFLEHTQEIVGDIVVLYRHSTDKVWQIMLRELNGDLVRTEIVHLSDEFNADNVEPIVGIGKHHLKMLTARTLELYNLNTIPNEVVNNYQAGCVTLLRAWREYHKLSIQELAEALEVTEQMLYTLELGEHPVTQVLSRMSELYGVSANLLLEDNEGPEIQPLQEPSKEE